MLKPAVFLDRDSTLTQRVFDETQRALVSPLQVELVSLRRGAAAFVRSLNRLGYLCLVLTQQPELATRRLTVVRLERIHLKLREDLARNGARLHGIFYSAEHPSLGPLGGGDAAPDPAQSLLIRAASLHQVNLRRSFVVSENATDMATGRAAGAETILMWDESELPDELTEVRPDYVARSLPQVLRIIESSREAALR
jgi:D-glycero-D-manno-heptose 1,7-bisphosphate phosphatase